MLSLLLGRLPGEYFPIDYSSGRNYMYPNGSLLLTSIEEKDGGYYLCQSNNSVGAGLSKLISLKVHGTNYCYKFFSLHTRYFVYLRLYLFFQLVLYVYPTQTIEIHKFLSILRSFFFL